MTLSPDEQAELRTTARSLLSRSSTSEQVRRVVATDQGFDPDLWAHIVELGWTTIHVPERLSGSGCGYAELAIVLHELGRALTPSPFLASAVLATGALMAADNEEVAGPTLAEIVGGVNLGTVAIASVSGSYEPAQRSVTWSKAGSEVRLEGISGFVLDADAADVMVVAARGADNRAAAVLVHTSELASAAIDRMPTIDLTRRLFTVAFDSVRIPADRMLTEPGPSADALLDGLLALGMVGAAVDAAGIAERALEVTAAYARERMQFGKPIGSFQAVKHHCANMAIAVEASRAATRAAAFEFDENRAAWRTTAAVAASYVGPACSNVCALAMRVHAGIGFTWEHDTHLWIKRVKLDEHLFGSPAWHRRRLANDVFPALVQK
jgi:alkylation response protein AidB-like acyl-CoA dehydrogenase